MMKKNTTSNLHLRLVSTALDITRGRERVSSPFGPVRAGLTISPDPRTLREERLRQLSGLLKYLEKEVETLSFRLAEACAISGIDIQDQPAEPYNSTTDTAGTDE